MLLEKIYWQEDILSGMPKHHLLLATICSYLLELHMKHDK